MKWIDKNKIQLRFNEIFIHNIKEGFKMWYQIQRLLIESNPFQIMSQN